jgi:hypothetical protein
MARVACALVAFLSLISLQGCGDDMQDCEKVQDDEKVFDDQQKCKDALTVDCCECKSGDATKWSTCPGSTKDNR